LWTCTAGICALLLFASAQPARAAGVEGTGTAAGCTTVAPKTALAGGGLGTLTPATRAQLRRAGVVGDAVVEALDRQQRVAVMVVLSVPASATAPGQPSAARRAAARGLRQSVLGSVEPCQFTVEHSFDSIAAFSGTVSGDGLLQLSSQAAVERIDLDNGGSARLTEAVPPLHLDAVQQLAFTGKGVTVAVLDTGVDTDHPDLADSLVAEHCFCSDGAGNGCCPDGSSEQDGAGSAEDDNGGGTYVTGIITSNGSIAPRGGAPDAQIVAVKVLDDNASLATTAQLVAGLDWILDNRPDVRVVTMGLGTSALFEGDCGKLDPPDATAMAVARAVDALTASGVLVVASSGNQCSGVGMPVPACIANTLSVGAVYGANLGRQNFPFPSVVCEGIPRLGCEDQTTQADQVTCFSNSNATTDLFAPGVNITSTGLDGFKSTFSGTSASSATAAACAAILLEVEPTLRPDELEVLLESSTTLVTDSTNGLSFPRLDCGESLAALVKLLPTATPTATPAMTSTATVTTSPTATTNTPTPTPPPCTGDCDGNGTVAIDELVLGVNIVLGPPPVNGCPAFASSRGSVDIAQLIKGVSNALNGCNR
jgi:subtilisin family serine protease